MNIQQSLEALIADAKKANPDSEHVRMFEYLMKSKRVIVEHGFNADWEVLCDEPCYHPPRIDYKQEFTKNFFSVLNSAEKLDAETAEKKGLPVSCLRNGFESVLSISFEGNFPAMLHDMEHEFTLDFTKLDYYENIKQWLNDDYLLKRVQKEIDEILRYGKYGFDTAKVSLKEPGKSLKVSVTHYRGNIDDFKADAFKRLHYTP